MNINEANQKIQEAIEADREAWHAQYEQVFGYEYDLTMISEDGQRLKLLSVDASNSPEEVFKNYMEAHPDYASHNYKIESVEYSK